MNGSPALNEQEVARRLGVSPFTLRAWRRQGRGPAYMKLGRAVRYRVADVAAFEASVLKSDKSLSLPDGRFELTPQ